MPLLLGGAVLFVLAITVPRLLGDDATDGFEAARTGQVGDEGWRRLPDTPISVDGSEAVAWTGDELFVWGDGFGSGALFDRVSGEWRATAAAPLDAGPVVAAPLHGEVLVVTSGCHVEGALCEAPEWAAATYDPAEDRWRPVSPPPLGPGGAAPALAESDDGVVLVQTSPESGAGGLPTWSYDAEGDRWEELDAAPSAPAGDPGFLVAGPERAELWRLTSAGEDGEREAVVTPVAEGGWARALPSLPTTLPAGGHPSLTGADRQVVGVVGDEARAYDRQGNIWGTLPDLPVTLGSHEGAYTGEELLLWGVDADGDPVGLAYR